MNPAERECHELLHCDRRECLPSGLVHCLDARVLQNAEGFPGSLCLTCYYRLHPPPEGAPPEPPASKARGLSCAHLGAPTGETRLCGTCQGDVRLKVFACAKHLACVPTRKVEGLACCLDCPDYQATEVKLVLGRLVPPAPE